jgi:hypothetical protein
LQEAEAEAEAKAAAAARAPPVPVPPVPPTNAAQEEPTYTAESAKDALATKLVWGPTPTQTHTPGLVINHQNT